MRSELEVLQKICCIDSQINMYLRHYEKYKKLEQKANRVWSDVFTDKAFKYKQKRKRIEQYLSMLLGMKSELLWVFSRC